TGSAAIGTPLSALRQLPRCGSKTPILGGSHPNLLPDQAARKVTNFFPKLSFFLEDQALAHQRRDWYHPSVRCAGSRRSGMNLVTSGRRLSGRKGGDLMDFLDDP